MRKIILSVYMSLDGVMAEPQDWTASYWNDEIAAFQSDDLFASDALLLGRVTYEGFAEAWAPRSGDAFTDRMNSLPKYVASKTLQTTKWNATQIKGDAAEEVSKLRQQHGQNLLIYGSANFAHTLRQQGLIDEYHILVYPVVLGKGKRLFEGGLETTTLKLVEAKPFASGVVALIYMPADAQTSEESTISGV